MFAYIRLAIPNPFRRRFILFWNMFKRGWQAKESARSKLGIYVTRLSWRGELISGVSVRLRSLCNLWESVQTSWKYLFLVYYCRQYILLNFGNMIILLNIFFMIITERLKGTDWLNILWCHNRIYIVFKLQSASF